MESFHEDPIFCCSQCNFTSQYNYDVEIHKRAEHKKSQDIFYDKHFNVQELSISCDLCDYKTTKATYMTWHMESFHEDKIFSC